MSYAGATHFLPAASGSMAAPHQLHRHTELDAPVPCSRPCACRTASCTSASQAGGRRPPSPAARATSALVPAFAWMRSMNSGGSACCGRDGAWRERLPPCGSQQSAPRQVAAAPVPPATPRIDATRVTMADASLGGRISLPCGFQRGRRARDAETPLHGVIIINSRSSPTTA